MDGTAVPKATVPKAGYCEALNTINSKTNALSPEVVAVTNWFLPFLTAKIQALAPVPADYLPVFGTDQVSGAVVPSWKFYLPMNHPQPDRILTHKDVCRMGCPARAVFDWDMRFTLGVFRECATAGPEVTVDQAADTAFKAMMDAKDVPPWISGNFNREGVPGLYVR